MKIYYNVKDNNNNIIYKNQFCLVHQLEGVKAVLKNRGLQIEIIK